MNGEVEISDEMGAVVHVDAQPLQIQAGTPKKGLANMKKRDGVLFSHRYSVNLYGW